MEKSMRELILEAASAMTESCHSMDFIVSKGERHLPDRGSVIKILKDLRRTMFPGFFGDENITLISPDYFIGDCLTHIYDELKKQVFAALYYRDYADKTREETEKEAEAICAVFFEHLPDIQKKLMKDVQAGFDGDPAAKSREDVVFSYPGLFAIFVYRIAHEFYLQDVPFLPRIMTEYAHSRTGIDINSGAEIGEYFFIDHGTGVVIGETTVIGDYVKLYQGVTLGGTGKDTGKRHPTIGDRVVISSGAKVLGPFKVGNDVKIGAGSVVLKEIPDGCTVVGIPGTVVRRNGKPTSELDQVDMPDPIAVELECLRRRIVELEEIIMENFGRETIKSCDEDCQYANILREIEEGELNKVFSASEEQDKSAETPEQNQSAAAADSENITEEKNEDL